MGNYNEALQLMPVDPDITKTRSYRYKYGCGVSFDQEITDDLGFFSRLGWNDGHSESWAFTEIDRTLSAGFVWAGAAGAGHTTGSAWLGSSMEYPVRIAITWRPGAWASSSATAG